MSDQLFKAVQLFQYQRNSVTQIQFYLVRRYCLVGGDMPQALLKPVKDSTTKISVLMGYFIDFSYFPPKLLRP